MMMSVNDSTRPLKISIALSGVFQVLFWVSYFLGWDEALSAVFICLSAALIVFNPWIYGGD